MHGGRPVGLTVVSIGALLALVATSGCAPGPSLAVQLVTDLTPGREFDAITITLDGASPQSMAARGDFDRSRRLASYEGLPLGRHAVHVALAWQGVVTQEATRTVEVTGASFVTVRITRDCRGITCPMEDATATECVAGVCVVPTCTPETPSACGTTRCDPLACSGGATCASRGCSPEGLCVTEPNDAACGANERCDTERGCVPRCEGPSCGAVACSWATMPTLTPPTPVASITTGSLELDPFLSRDGLTLLFGSDRAGTFDIYEAHRPNVDADFDAPVLRPELSSPSIDVAPFVFVDPIDGETETWVASNREADALGRGFELYRALDPSPLARVLELSTTADEFDPRLNRTGLTLWFTRGDGIWVAQRPALHAAFGPATQLTELGTSIGDPATTDDELTMFFARADATRGQEIWIATRTSPSVPWGNPHRVDALNGDTTTDGQLFVRSDGCEVLFERNGDIVQSRVVP